MSPYNACSKDELLHIIEKLEKENTTLREELDLSVKTLTTDKSNEKGIISGSGRFKEKYATKILDSLPDMLTVISHSGTLVDLVSSEETNHVNENGNDLIGKDISEIVPPEAYSNIKQNLDLVVATNQGSIAHHDLWFQNELHHYENRIFPLDSQYTLCMCRDVTETVNSQRALELANRKIKDLNDMMDAILNNIPVYLFVKDPANEFRYLYWNKAFEEHSHIPASFVLGKTDSEVFPNSKDAEKFRKDDLELLKTGKRIEFIEEYTTATGEKRIVTTSKALVPCENKVPLIIGVSWDITDLKNAEKELIAARIRAEESDKLKSAFLANMSHEIRTPLNAIVGFSKLIADTDNPFEKQQFFEIINRNSEMLLQLINDILDISKIEAGTLEFVNIPMDLGELCQNLYEIHKNRVEEGVQLTLKCSHEHLQYTGDPNRISQVITNLINNACKFTHKGEISFGFQVNNDFLEFFVKDTGDGIPEEKLNSIFDRFIKLNSFAQGTGLGLAISKMIVEKMGGKIKVASKENTGSIFSFVLPYQNEDIKMFKQEETKEDNLHIPAKNPTSEQKTILIAEDVESNYLLLRAFLGKLFKLVHAKNGLEVLDIYEQCNPDLILMDIKMPEMDGLDATRILRKRSVTTPIVALTAFAFESDKKEALEAGCNDFLTKPVAKEALFSTIHKYI